MAHVTHLGAHPNLIDLYRRYPGIARHVLGLTETAFTLTEEFSHGECELLGSYISWLNGCDYCHGIHTEAAVACGIGRESVSASENAPAYGGARWQPAFAFVKALTSDPASVSGALVRALTDAGWSDDAVVQLSAICSAFNVLNRLVEGLGLSADESFYAQAGKRLASVGYGGTAKMLGVAG